MWRVTLIAGALLLGWVNVAAAQFASSPSTAPSHGQEKNRPRADGSLSGDFLLDRNAAVHGITANGITSRYWEHNWNKDKKDGSNHPSYKPYNPITIPLW